MPHPLKRYGKTAASSFLINFIKQMKSFTFLLCVVGTPGGTSSLVGYLSYFLQLIDASLKDIVARISCNVFPIIGVSVDVNQDIKF